MSEEDKNISRKKYRDCLIGCGVFLLILILALIFFFYEAQKWFHDFSQSAKQATQQSQTTP
jgi:uncharacterized protein YpmB